MASKTEDELALYPKETHKMIVATYECRRVFCVWKHWKKDDLAIRGKILKHKELNICVDATIDEPTDMIPTQVKEDTDGEFDDYFCDKKYEYTNYGEHKDYGYCVGFSVGVGDLMNGNDCAYVKKEGDYYYYNEHGYAPFSRRLGETLLWCNKKHKFNVE